MTGAALGAVGAFTPPTDFVRLDVSAGGVRLNAWRLADVGRRPPPVKVLVLHGAGEWGLDWVGLARAAVGRLDCVLLDQRGHGYSEKPPHGYTDVELAGDAALALAALQWKKAAVLGHSLGGAAALALAATAPARVERLLLVDPTIRLGSPAEGGVPADSAAAASAARAGGSTERRRAALRAQQAKGFQALLAQLRVTHPDWSVEDAMTAVQARLLVSPFTVPDGPATDPIAQAGFLGRIKCPTLLVRGEPGRRATVDDDGAARILAAAPAGRLEVATTLGGGHTPHREALPAFLDVVLPFLEG